MGAPEVEDAAAGPEGIVLRAGFGLWAENKVPSMIQLLTSMSRGALFLRLSFKVERDAEERQR